MQTAANPCQVSRFLACKLEEEKKLMGLSVMLALDPATVLISLVTYLDGWKYSYSGLWINFDANFAELIQ